MVLAGIKMGGITDPSDPMAAKTLTELGFLRLLSSLTLGSWAMMGTILRSFFLLNCSCSTKFFSSVQQMSFLALMGRSLYSNNAVTLSSLLSCCPGRISWTTCLAIDLNPALVTSLLVVLSSNPKSFFFVRLFLASPQRAPVHRWQHHPQH